MTKPTITWGHGFLDDCDATTGWTETESGLVASIASDGDIFTITGTCDAAGNEFAYYEKDITNISTTTYPYALVRWKTSAASNGLQATINFQFSDASDQDVPLGYSTNWTTTTITLTAAKTIDKIRLIADDNPDTIAADTFYVYFDFIMICASTFTFPKIAPGNLRFTVDPRYVDIEIPGRVGDITQYMGMASPLIHMEGDIDTGTGWHGPSSLDAEYLYLITKEGHHDPWQWFTSDLINCKVTPRTFNLIQDSEGTGVKKWSWDLKMFQLGDGGSDLGKFALLQWFGK